eukprot:3159161-Pleurochrysis_carterae.AAC.1
MMRVVVSKWKSSPFRSGNILMKTWVLQVKVDRNGRMKTEHASNTAAREKAVIDKSFESHSTSNLVRPIGDINKKMHYLRVGQVIRKACLLYTSPSPRDGLLS